jgi:hypothetical protein
MAAIEKILTVIYRRPHGQLDARAMLSSDFGSGGAGWRLYSRTSACGEESIYQACTLRFRPIPMTTMAALLGTVPMMVGTGVGSEIRQPLGYAIVGSLAVSQILTLHTTPVNVQTSG